ncbi:4Fe-4S binding protein, partial [Chloroflexota bacterium]
GGLSLSGLPARTFLVSVRAEVSPTVQLKRKGMLHCVQYYKDAMLDRFYAICNCCACCCGAMHAHRHGTPMLASSGYVAQVDADLCAGCGSCVDVCQFSAILVDDGFACIDAAACMGCGVCVSKCPQGAFALVRDPGRGEPLEIQKLMASAGGTTQD